MRMPSAQGVDPAVGLSRLNSSVKLVQAKILAVCDDSGTTTLNYERRVVGWDVPLNNSFRKALSSPQAATVDLPRLVDGFFTQVRERLKTDDTEPSAFKRFLQLLTAHFDTGNQGQGFAKIHSYGVPTNTGFASYIRCGKYLFSVIQGALKVFKPGDAIAIEYIRSSVSQPYPSLMPTLFPGALTTAVEPYSTVLAMWQAFDVLAANKTPAINGERVQAHSTDGTISCSTNPFASQQYSI